mgnify:CR=1 FL=1
MEPSTGDLFTARFADCHFDESVFPVLGGETDTQRLVTQQLTWNASKTTNLDPRNGQSEYEVQKLINLQRTANELPDAFVDTNRVTKSHIPVSNTPAKTKVIHDEITIQRKRGRPIGSRDKNPRKQKEQDITVGRFSQHNKTREL